MSNFNNLKNDLVVVAGVTLLARQFKLELLNMSPEQRLEYVKQHLLTLDLHDEGGEPNRISFQYLNYDDNGDVTVMVGFQWEDCGRDTGVIPSPRRSLSDDGDECVQPIMLLTFKKGSVDESTVLSDGYDDFDDESEFDDDSKYNESQQLINDNLIKVEVYSYNSIHDPYDKTLYVPTTTEDQIMSDFGLITLNNFKADKISFQELEHRYNVPLTEEYVQELEDAIRSVKEYSTESSEHEYE